MEIAGPPLSAYRNEEEEKPVGLPSDPVPVVCNTPEGGREGERERYEEDGTNRGVAPRFPL